MNKENTLGSLVGLADVDDWESFNLESVNSILGQLKQDQAVDEQTALIIQQQALAAADLLVDFLSKLTKSVSILEQRITKTKALTALNYKPAEGRATIETRKWAAEASEEVEALVTRLARLKGARVGVENKFDILIKAHHYYKDIVQGHRKSNGLNALGTPYREETQAVGWR